MKIAPSLQELRERQEDSMTEDEYEPFASTDPKVVPIWGRARQRKPAPISAQDLQKILSDMTRLSPVEYDLKRFEIADRIGVARGWLDLEYRRCTGECRPVSAKRSCSMRSDKGKGAQNKFNDTSILGSVGR
jgi:hypothetical protein